VEESAASSHNLKSSREEAAVTHNLKSSREEAAVGDVDDEESKVCGRGLSDGGEPEAGTNAPADMALYDDPCDMALWDARREDAARCADNTTHL